jgi:RNA polymerase sigma factor (sigma-70 family)
MARFSTTHWSIILLAKDAQKERAREALEHVCQRYWYPLYAYVRRRGYNPVEAQDATQDFFMHLQEKELLRKTNPEAGLFRTFLLTSLKNHLLTAEKKKGRLKRGGGVRFVSLDAAVGEERFVVEPNDERSPEKLFERSWALNLLDQAMTILEGEYQASNRKDLLDQLREALIPDASSPSYEQMAQTLGKSPGAIKVAAHRMRQRYREIVNGLVASTVSDPTEVRQELEHLRSVLS